MNGAFTAELFGRPGERILERFALAGEYGWLRMLSARWVKLLPVTEIKN